MRERLHEATSSRRRRQKEKPRASIETQSHNKGREGVAQEVAGGEARERKTDKAETDKNCFGDIDPDADMDATGPGTPCTGMLLAAPVAWGKDA